MFNESCWLIWWYLSDDIIVLALLFALLVWKHISIDPNYLLNSNPDPKLFDFLGQYSSIISILLLLSTDWSFCGFKSRSWSFSSYRLWWTPSVMEIICQVPVGVTLGHPQDPCVNPCVSPSCSIKILCRNIVVPHHLTRPLTGQDVNLVHTHAHRGGVCGCVVINSLCFSSTALQHQKSVSSWSSTDDWTDGRPSRPPCSASQ